MPSAIPTFVPLNVAVIGGGLGGCSAAIALRRQGHKVTIYERRDFAGEVGASISCAANGGQWLHEWGVDVPSGKPVDLKKLIMRDWRTGDVMSVYDLGEYKKTWGYEYYMFHRQEMHTMLFTCATQQEGEGEPVKFVPFHKCAEVDYDAGVITFENGNKVTADLIIGADGVSSKVRASLGIVPDLKPADLTCYRCNIEVDRLRELGLEDYSVTSAIDYWGGQDKGDGIHKYFKLVLAPCSDGKLLSFYNFFPAGLSDHHTEGFVVKEATQDELCEPFKDTLDPKVLALLQNSIDRMPWRLWIHQPYPYWVKGKAVILGDAAHPMLPNQSQGACQAIEDAAALGIIFSKDYNFTTNVEAGCKLYEEIRKPRATKVQAASIRATDDINERIGFSSLPEAEARAAFKQGKLTVEEMNRYQMKEHVAELAPTFASFGAKI
ncbi:FAD/NAD-P-binding domain-containing protein [Meredithblackwellia eburnea MCA 4105]